MVLMNMIFDFHFIVFILGSAVIKLRWWKIYYYKLHNLKQS